MISPVGAQERLRPAGADVAVIIPDSLPDVPRTLTELLAARVPGLTVQRATGSIGGGSWVSLRDGAAMRGADPLIVVDGVRRARHVLGEARFQYLWQANSFADYERRPPSPLDDIPVEDVERIEILRGAPAAREYGPDGRYGVIVVTTRTPGRNRPLAVSLGGGAASSPLDFERATIRVAGDGSPCPLGDEGSSCVATGSSRYTPLRDNSLLSGGTQRSIRVAVDRRISLVAGTAAVSHERVDGVLPSDGRDRTSATARASAPLGPIRLDYIGQWTGRGVALPIEDGLNPDPYALGAAYFPRDCSPSTPCGSDVVSRGYGAGLGVNSEWLDDLGVRVRRMRTSHGLIASIDPTSWVRLETRVSGDWFKQRTRWLPDQPLAFLPLPTQDRRLTARFTALEQEARFQFRTENRQFLTRAAFRYDRGEAERRFYVTSFEYTPTPYGGYGYGLVNRQQSQRGVDFRRVHALLEQRVAAGRLDAGVGLTAARLTDWSGHVERPTLVDPSADVAFTLRQLPTHTLRLRAAAGSIQSFEPLPPSLDGVILGRGSGERPDRLVEIETGLDLTAGASRAALTLYQRDEHAQNVAIVGTEALQPPRRFEAAERTIRGIELTGAGAVSLVGMRAHLDGMVAFEADRVTKAPRVLSYQRGGMFAAHEGGSYGSWEGASIQWTDSDADGRVDWGEFGEMNTPLPAGRSRPSRLAALQTDVLVGSRWRLGAHLDYRGGHLVANSVERARCLARVCAPMHDATASAAAQLDAWSAFTWATARGFLVPGDAIRAREISLSYEEPALARAIGATTMRMTFAVKNAGFIWSRAKVWDPETAAAGTIDVSNVSAGVQAPIPREVVFRASLTY